MLKLNALAIVLLLSLLLTVGGFYYINTQVSELQKAEPTPIDLNTQDLNITDLNTQDVNAPLPTTTQDSACTNFLTKMNNPTAKQIGSWMCKIEEYAKGFFQKTGLDAFRVLFWTCIFLFIAFMISQFFASSSAKMGGILLLVVFFILLLVMLGVL